MLNLNKLINGFLIRLKVELVEDAKEWKRWWSMRWIIIGGFCAGSAAAYQWMPDDWLPTIPEIIKKALALGALISMGMAGAARVIKQKFPEIEDEQAQDSAKE